MVAYLVEFFFRCWKRTRTSSSLSITSIDRQICLTCTPGGPSAYLHRCESFALVAYASVSDFAESDA